MRRPRACGAMKARSVRLGRRMRRPYNGRITLRHRLQRAAAVAAQRLVERRRKVGRQFIEAKARAIVPGPHDRCGKCADAGDTKRDGEAGIERRVELHLRAMTRDVQDRALALVEGAGKARRPQHLVTHRAALLAPRRGLPQLIRSIRPHRARPPCSSSGPSRLRVQSSSGRRVRASYMRATTHSADAGLARVVNDDSPWRRNGPRSPLAAPLSLWALLAGSYETGCSGPPRRPRSACSSAAAWPSLSSANWMPARS